jgi:hypothetical protein
MVRSRAWNPNPRSPVRHSVVVVTLVACCAVVPFACGPDPRAGQQLAVVAVEQFGGSVVRDFKRDGDPVVKVDLADKPVSDADLVPLKGLTQLNALVLRKTRVTDAGLANLLAIGKLRNLDLDHTPITDAGLTHLGELTSLRDLRLARTGITDAGLAHLRPLTKLWVLGLGGTNVSDAGLIHLRGLTNLRVLDLQDTKVTEAGVAKLRSDLPHAQISFRSHSRSNY